MFNSELTKKHLVAFILTVLILVVIYLIRPFPEVPKKDEIKDYPIYFDQDISGKIDNSLVFRGRCYITLSSGQKMRLPWANNVISDFSLWEYLEVGDSIKVKSDTIYLIKDRSIFKFKIIE